MFSCCLDCPCVDRSNLVIRFGLVDMALTLEIEQKLGRASLIQFFEDDRQTWLDVAQQAHDYIQGQYPDGSAIRPDDIQDVVEQVLKVNEALHNVLARKKLTQKYWYSHFADLIIDRTWDEITEEEEEEEEDDYEE